MITRWLFTWVIMALRAGTWIDRQRQFYEESVRVPMLVRCPSMFEE